MPKRLVSWGVLLFSFTMILVSYIPKDNGWSASYDSTYHIPIVGIPVLGYQIMGGICGVISLFFVIAGFWERWSNILEEYILNKLSYLLFIIYWLSYIMGYLKGVGSLVSNAQPTWLVEPAFFLGFILFLIIPVHYFKWLLSQRKVKLIPVQSNSTN